MPTYPLLKNFPANGIIGWRNGAAVTTQHFLSAARALACRMPSGVHCMNLCQDRLNFALGVAAALIKGTATLLPPNRAVGVLREIARDHGSVCCVTDHDVAPTAGTVIDLAQWPSTAERAIANAPVPLIPGEQTAIIAFTSGTTGKSRPHARTWASYAQGAQGVHSRLPLKPGAVLLGTVPPQHMWGLEASVVLAFHAGCAIHSATPLLPADFCALLEQTKEERWLVTTPLHLRALVLGGGPLPRLTGVLTATAPLDAAIARDVETKTGATVIEIYGTTETGALATRATASTTSYRFLDGVRSTTKNHHSSVQGGHVHEQVQLNDRLRQTGEEHFELEGRITDMVKIGGKRASLSVLNQELTAIPGVDDGAFFLPEKQTPNARLIAFVVAPGLTRSGIISALRARIDPVFLPRPLVLVSHLPRNPAGKLTHDSMRGLAARLHEPSMPERS